MTTPEVKFGGMSEIIEEKLSKINTHHKDNLVPVLFYPLYLVSGPSFLLLPCVLVN